MLKNRIGEGSGRMLAALTIFLTTAALAIILNATVGGYGWHVGWSISKYVGLELWSVIMFAVGNCFVAALMGSYMWQLGQRWGMPKFYYVLILMVVVALLAVSFCPFGFCDVGGAKGIVTRAHEFSSRSLFVIMMVIAAMIAIYQRVNRLTMVLNVAFVIFAICSVVGDLTKAAWFTPLILIYETSYLLGFMLIVMYCGATIGRRSKDN